MQIKKHNANTLHVENTLMQHNPQIVLTEKLKKLFVFLTKLLKLQFKWYVLEEENTCYYYSNWPLELKTEIIAYASLLS